MADEKKTRDRQRPFRKVEPRPAAEAIDGAGVPRGCFPPSFLGDVDQNVIAVLTQNIPALGKLHDALEAAKKVVRGILTALELALVAQAIALLGLGPGVALAAPVLIAIRQILATTEDVLDLVEKRIVGRIVKRLLPRACRVMPHWVPVKRGASNDVVDDGQLVEVQGIVTRSYQNPIDVPFFQWHHWFSWSLHVRPDPGFEKVLSPAPNPPRRLDMSGGEEPIQEDRTIECQWDCGTLFRNHQAYEAGVPPGAVTSFTGPMARADWAWPMPGQFVWVAGRWVYDCSRATTDDGNGLMATVLNPLKALATVRREGFKFPENAQAVPATQFMFFACKRGGYLDHDRLDDRDYEFIVDLPDLEEEEAFPHPVGRTEKDGADFDHNTIVLRPRLLQHVDTAAFAISGAPALEPVVELLPPERGRVPTQVRVKVPTSQLGPRAEACGFILSLGWFDEEGVQAEKVRQCTVRLKRIEGGPLRVERDKPDEITKVAKEIEAELVAEAKDRVHKAVTSALGDTLGGAVAAILGGLIDFFVKEIVDAFVTAFTKAIEDLLSSDEEWLIHVGVNGRWLPFRFDFDGKSRELAGAVTFFLLDGEPIRISMSGADFDPVGDLMLASKKDRALDLDGAQVSWQQIVDPHPDGATALAIRRRLVLRYVFLLLTRLGDDNDPTGFVEQKHVGLEGEQVLENLFSNAFHTRALEDQRTIVEDKLVSTTDHALRYAIELKRQAPPDAKSAA